MYTSPFPKVRLGNPNGDGGYCICELPDSYDGCLSGGAGNDCSFEDAFVMKYPNLPFCTIYDGHVNNFPYTQKPIQFIRKNLAALNTSTTTNLNEELAAAQNLFVKLDIEGDEFQIVPTWVSLMNNIKQFVLEIHIMHRVQNGKQFNSKNYMIEDNKIYDLLHIINQTHTLVHLHPNNYGPTYTMFNITLPTVFECTFIRNEYNLNKKFNTDPIPSSIDVNNNHRSGTVSLTGWPFVGSPPI